MVLYKICRELAFVCYIEFFAITRYVITRVECICLSVFFLLNAYILNVNSSWDFLIISPVNPRSFLQAKKCLYNKRRIISRMNFEDSAI